MAGRGRSGLRCAVRLVAVLLISGCGSAPPKSSFRNDVRTIFWGNCRCHVDNVSPPAGLDLTAYDRLMNGGRVGSEIVPFKPDSSNLYRRVARGEMPPTGKLANEDIRIIRRWIEPGAKNN